MADINIEKKKRPVWPWILAILLAAAVIWLIAGNNENEYESEMSTVQTEEQYNNQNNQAQDTIYNERRRNNAGQQGAAMAYVNFIEENGDNVTKSHEYSKQALTHLSEAVNEIAQQNNVSVENKNELDKIKKQADKLTQERNSTEHANILDDAFNSVAQVINNIQQEQFPDLKEEAQAVKNAADKVKPGVVVTNQKDAVKGFFTESASTLEAMQNQNQNVSMK